MNKTLKKTVIAVAIATLFGATAAYAQDGGGRHHQGDPVSFEKKIKLRTDVRLEGDPTVSGNINIDSAAISIVDNKQTNAGNFGQNDMVTNDADVDGNAGRETSGNIGANVAAGDNNQQDNAAALSAADASFTFGMADSEVFVDQQGALNQTYNAATTNQATVGNSAFRDASGNIGVNVTAGNNNQQKNAMAASVATSSYAQATVSSNQASGGNETINALYEDVYMTSVEVSLSGSGSGSYSGSGQGSADLGLSGAVDQIGDVYPDTWTGTSHPGGSQTGHIDLDTAVQGGSDLNGDGGALAFGYTDDSSASGGLGFEESGDVALDNINLTGTVNYLQISYLPTTNSASLGDNAFRGASGNIGINVSAGTGNQQANSLAMAVAQPGTGGGGGGE